MAESRSRGFTRRAALELLGMSAAAAVPSGAFAQAPAFPNGAVIRTVLKDYAPEELAGGGFYNQPFYPKEIATMSEEQIVQALIKQVDTDTIGAFGEIGSWDEITADERRVFRAIGKAHVATNIPIFTHTGTVFVPKLKAAGASDEVLHRIMVDNPRRFLAFVPKRPRRG